MNTVLLRRKWQANYCLYPDRRSTLTRKFLTWIFAIVLASRKVLITFHRIRNPEPALMIKSLFKVWENISDQNLVWYISAHKPIIQYAIEVLSCKMRLNRRIDQGCRAAAVEANKSFIGVHNRFNYKNSVSVNIM